jgi:2-polyprenyl-3-methyl-5-hydroxy-6-metoxy-1,4-benzoquinol methylase
MARKKKANASVSAHYDATIDVSRDQYDTRALRDPALEYPANHFRLQLLLESFKKKKIRRVFEIGVGEGTPLIALANAGMDVRGIDIAPRMVEASKANLTKLGLDPERVFRGDIEDPKTYEEQVRGIPLADGLMAMGVMPHVVDDERALRNMAQLVRKGGSVFIEFRNILFSLFTQNRYTEDFILDELLRGVDRRMKKIVAHDLLKRLRTDQPLVRASVRNSSAPGYDAVLSKFHNPFEVIQLFEKLGFRDMKLLWYHYHPAMPYLVDKDAKLFRKEAVKLEGEHSGWRGYFLCSAFVVEART